MYSTPASTTLEADRLNAWWDSLNDPVLTSLLATAETNNLDLKVAFHRIQESRANYCVVAGLKRPTGGGEIAYEYKKRSQNARPFVGTNGVPFNLFTLGTNATWELDFFGRIERSIEAAQAKIEFDTADYDHIRLTLLADVAESYFKIRWLQEQIDINQKLAQFQKDAMELVESRAKAGVSTKIAITQTKAFQLRNESEIPALVRQVQVEYHRLSLLLGGMSDQELKELIGVRPLPSIPPVLGIGLPTNLLRQRPDVMRQEKAVAAASAKIGIAESDLYPRFQLLGTLAVGSKNVSSLFETESMIFSIGPSIQWNIFNRRSIFSNIEVYKEKFNQAVANYQKTVLQAVAEVEDSLARQRGFQEEAEIIERALALDAEAVELNLERYKLGKTNFQRVLDARQQLLDDRKKEINARAQSLIQLVHLYKAVGGGGAPVGGDCLDCSPLPEAESYTLAEPTPQQLPPIDQQWEELPVPPSDRQQEERLPTPASPDAHSKPQATHSTEWPSTATPSQSYSQSHSQPASEPIDYWTFEQF